MGRRGEAYNSNMEFKRQKGNSVILQDTEELVNSGKVILRL